MANFLPLLADRIMNRPLLIDPGKAEVIFAVLEGRILPAHAITGEGGAGFDELIPRPDASRLIAGQRRTERGMTRAVGSTAIITVDGSLVNRGAWVGASSGLTSYEGIAAQLDDAAGDPAIKSVIIDMNSYGGEATGMFALASKVRKVAESKRVIAVVNDVAASAGYGIISGAHEIVVSETSLVGSIGVVMMHIDRSGEMKMKGLNPTFIHAGARKVDGHPFAALSEGVRADLQASCDTLYARFLETVAAGRGARLSIEKARATEAGTAFGQDAITAGLADRIGTFDDVLSELQRPAMSGRSKQETSRMDNTAQHSGGITLEAHNTAIAAARAEGVVAGAADEKNRIKSIVTSDAAKGREATAQTFALDTDMSADDAIKVLATTPAGATVGIPSIQQRADGSPEMGGSPLPTASAEVVAAGWGAAFKNTSAS